MAITARQLDFLGPYVISIVAIIVILGIAIGVSAFAAKRIGKGVAAPVEACAERMKALAKGDFTVKSQFRENYVGDFSDLIVVIDGLEKIRQGAIASAQSSAEQAEAMREVEDEINQITDVVQNNSATAEESSATCQELSAQAIGLNDLVEGFTIE